MEISNLLNNLNSIQITGEFQRKDVESIVYDSRKVKKNSIFVAIKGYKTDGHKYIFEAINKGAIAVVLEEDNTIPDEIFRHQNILKILVKNSRIALAALSKDFWNSPSEKLKLIGITGTNGKTTTSYFIKKILETSGYKVGLAGTIANYIGENKINSSLTTPESNDMNSLLFDMHKQGCKYAVMEVSSHSLDLERTHFLNFSCGVFTNITSDHLDFHIDFKNYFEAKRKLFLSLTPSAFGVYNADDCHSIDLIKNSSAQLYSFGQASNADFNISNINYDLSGTQFEIRYKNNLYTATTSLIGEFNAYNACAAFAATVLSGVETKTAIKGIKETQQIPGRFEKININDKTVIVDYSHTADSLGKALLAIKKITKDQVPVYTIFGCGGNRDKSKRPEMGKIATELSDKVFITSDNPRDEDPLTIIKDIEKGTVKKNYKIIPNRKEAILEAIEKSEKESVILIAGKGHEDYQEIKGKRAHFSDKEIVQSFLKI
ncbi:MAG: UDP-N-acetylmuramoyl-L-alanyl-D-glutamate--2,6-diaminopimelate ligase [Ignavibacteriales bacterium CG_4_9_14_3_um_filter_30_11]|nr:MAG: UDP-N-acetylmuramoyl-L-alanyl-D-glutamate--2,6-diaminopimelate ligase [Ignavibacteriales bacterium CG_4_9_14_3_um_filter_30_11]